MCKHILNAQVSIRSPCCKKWFDCAECHAETEDHKLLQRFEMVFLPLYPLLISTGYEAFACKKCKKCFRKDTKEWDESDEYCPFCDNHFVLEAKTAKPMLQVEGDDLRIDSRMVKDERIKGEAERSIFNIQDQADRLG
ncbi:hypothetical protein RUND412_002740 [Rhizina undulata]